MIMYNQEFYKNNVVWGKQSANIVVPIIKRLFDIHSVVDFGCGTGAWLSVLKSNGVTDIKGYDGEYVLKNKLLIDKSEFCACDLEKRIHVDKKYEMAISLEVAEHLSLSVADMFVDELIEASDLILFSAAIPGQGGIGHINEQWQNWWATKFIEKGYTPIDIIREKIKGLQQVRPYYRQNMAVYTSRKDIIEKYAGYVEEYINEYMVAENVDWIREEYEKTIQYQKIQIRIIHHMINMMNSGELVKKIKEYGWKKIGVYGMGDIGEILLNYLSCHIEVIGFDNYKELYTKYDCFIEKSTLDAVVITVIRDIDFIKVSAKYLGG